jgi:phage/plasmid-associated DNA primase
MGGNQSKEDDVTASARSDRITTIGRTERVMHRKETKPSSTRSTTKATTSTTPTSSNKKSQSNGKSASVSTKQEKRALKNKLKDSIKARSSRKLKMPDLDESGRMSEREVTSRREISSESSSITIADGKITIEYAFCTQRGYYPDGALLLFLYVNLNESILNVYK